MKYPKRYLKGVNKIERIKELEARKNKRSYKDLFPKKTDIEAQEKGIIKKSKFTTLFNKYYPKQQFNLNQLSIKFKIPLFILKEIYDKGLKAWKTSGSRAGANAQMWAVARVYKYILIHKGLIKEAKRDPDAYLRKMKIQSIIFNKKYYNIEQATQWLKENHLKIKKVDITKNYLRFRQIAPSVDYDYRTKTINKGLKILIIRL